MSARTKKIDPLSKKVPVNPKYKDVKSTIDTGHSQSKYLAKLEEIKKNYKFRKDEIFKRMKVATFVQLVLQVADFESFLNDIPSTGDIPLGDTPLDNGDTERCTTADLEVQKVLNRDDGDSVTVETSSSTVPETTRSRLEQVIKGVGEINVDESANPSKALTCDDRRPYLLLDVRDRDSYDECHIISAKSYPTAMLARSVNYETKDMLAFKNMEGKIIIVYDNDETQAPRAATTLVQRGYDNLFMLSGGLKVAYKSFKEGLISGTPSVTITEKKAPKDQEIVPATDASFTRTDLDNLLYYIEKPDENDRHARLYSGRSSKASLSSRMSTVSSMNSSRSINSVRSEASIHPKPFK